jgi:hypothetical protein
MSFNIRDVIQGRRGVVASDEVTPGEIVWPLETKLRLDALAVKVNPGPRGSIE